MNISASIRKAAWFRLFTAEAKESFRMAMGALAAHKLRSALTLLGVLVGVFSIIVVMTAMRVMQNNIEAELSRLGSQTFQIRKWPGIYFGGRQGFEKYWRRKSLTLAQGETLKERATLPLHIGFESYFWAGEATSRYGKTPPGVRLLGETPGSFPAMNWSIKDGRALLDSDVDGARDVCILGDALAKYSFRSAPLWMNASNSTE